MHIVYFYICLYSFYGPCGPEIKLYYYIIIIQLTTRVGDAIFAIVLMFFAYKKMLGRIETQARDRIYCQAIRTVRDISRDDRSRIATCSLRTPTEIRGIIV